MGEVWSATHSISGRRFAVKFLKPSRLNPDMRRRFLREARAASLVDHPGVVNVLDVFELDGGLPVMVMDLLRGETLAERLARDTVLPQAEAARLLLPVVEAVRAAHQRGVVHRDLKPDNIFLETEHAGRTPVKVLDFGVAKLIGSEADAFASGALTESGALLGTPRYMAPEQCAGEPLIDARADIWALGVILYECLCGQKPIDGANLGQVVTRLLRDDIVPLATLAPGLAPQLTSIVGRMLARERDDRPRDLAEVERVLSELAGAQQGLVERRATRKAGPSLLRFALPALGIVIGSVAWTLAQRPAPAAAAAAAKPPPTTIPAPPAPIVPEPAPEAPAAAAPAQVVPAAFAPAAASSRSHLPAPGVASTHRSASRVVTGRNKAPAVADARATGPLPAPPQPRSGLFDKVPF
jgi:serine/threonine-protein kinase